MRSVNVPPTSTPSRFMPQLPRRACACRRLRSWTEQDLPEVRAPLERRERLLHVVERIARVHEGSQQAAGGEREDLLQLLARVDEGSDHRVLTPEERDDVELDHLAGVRAAGHEAPFLGERLQGLGEQLAADVLEHE